MLLVFEALLGVFLLHTLLSQGADGSLDEALAGYEDRWIRRCTIPRRPPLQPGQRLSGSSAPYIIGMPDGHNRQLANQLSRDILVNLNGNLTCTPTAAGSTRRGNYEMTLGDYIENWMTKELSRNASENRYVFGEFSDQWAPFRDLYMLPPCGSCDREDVAITIGLGGLHSGAPWHFHNGGFVEMLHGSKHFALLPPGDPAIPEVDSNVRDISQLHWHREVRPEMERNGRLANLQECIVGQGELLYFPSKWHHGVVNMDPYTAFVSTFLPGDDS